MITLRDPLEVQKAHDILTAIVLGEVPIDTDDADPVMMVSLRSALDTLCWVLRHEHNTAFAANIARIEKALESRGGVFRRAN